MLISRPVEPKDNPKNIVAIRISSLAFVGLAIASAIPGLLAAPESVVLALWGAGLVALNVLLKAGPAEQPVRARSTRATLTAPLVGHPVEN